MIAAERHRHSKRQLMKAATSTSMNTIRARDGLLGDARPTWS
jgi:hypothetical protein